MNAVIRVCLRGALLALALLPLIPIPLAQAETLRVYAGAGLRPAIEKLTQAFERDNGHRIILEYGGSGQIMTRYLASREGDLFIPGSRLYIDKLAQRGLIVDSFDIVTHTPVVGVFKGSKQKIDTFEDLQRPGVRIGLGDPQAMALGRTAETILDASGVGDRIRANISLRAGTVKQLALYLSRGDVDAAIIGRSDAVLNSDSVRMIGIPAQWYTPEIVGVAILGTSRQPELAMRLARFLASDEGIAAFTEVGFLPLPNSATP